MAAGRVRGMIAAALDAQAGNQAGVRRRMRTQVSVALTAVLLASLVAPAAGSPSSAAGRETTYLVVSSTETAQEATPGATAPEAAQDAGGQVVESFPTLNAAVAELTDAEATRLDDLPGVVVAPDTPMTVIRAGRTTPLRTKARSWGLDRLDQRAARLDGRFSRRPGIDGSGVHVYVVDTGLATGHPAFRGRVGTGRDFVGDGRGVQDCHGHGTHVAGTIASAVTGVAPRAVVHPVRIADCSGWSTAGAFLAALDYIAAVAPRAAVVNASMGGPRNEAVNAAVSNLVARGTPVVVAAGNDSDDARQFSPGSAGSAITVAASERGDRHAAFSNHGSAVDLYAPGSGIVSASSADPTTLVAWSGTSMAAPHVAGYLALYFDRHPRASVAAATRALLAQSTQGALRGVPAGTPNRLVYTYGVAARQKVAVRAVGKRSKLRVDVNPDVGAQAWKVTVQRKQGPGFGTVRKVRTRGPDEVVTVNLPRGTYRVVVPARYGYATAVSRTVFLRR